MRFVIFLLFTVFTATQSDAWELVGANDPKFITAKNAWLTDETRGICMLLQLADQGNAAAAWFVHGMHPNDQKCNDPNTTTPILVEKWLEETAALEPALERLFKDELKGVERVEFLLNLGEPRRAFEYLFEVERIDTIQHDDPDQAPNVLKALSPAEAQWLDPDLKLFFLIHVSKSEYATSISDETWLYWFETACRRNRLLDEPFQPLLQFCSTARVSQAFFDAYVDSRSIKRSTAVVQNLKAWLASDWRTEPYRTVCNEVCPSNSDGCLYPVFLINSAMYGLFFLHSPSEMIVPQRVFASSERAAGNVWRGVKHGFSYFPDWVGKSLDHNGAAQCLIDQISNGDVRWDREQ